MSTTVDPHDAITEAEIPVPLSPPARSRPTPRWPARFRRFLAMYDNARATRIPTRYLAYGVQFPDGQIVLWHAGDGYVDLHKDIAAMRNYYLKHGNFSVRFFTDVEQS